MKENGKIKNAFFDLQLFGDASDSGDSGSVDAGQEFSGASDTDFDGEFADLIKGKYKDAFARKTQSIINRRFKETKELEEYRDKTEGVLSLLRERYGIEAGDFDGLMARLQDDGERESSDAPVLQEPTASDTEAYDTVRTAESAAEKVRSQIGYDKHFEKAVRQYGKWQEEAEGLKEIYPDFDLKKESSNPQFTSLLMGGADLKLAYESVHHDEILSGAMEYTARQVSEAMSRSFQARGNRPFENGLGAKSAINPSKDVNSLTDNDISEILKQVAKGKIIRF